MQKISFIVDGKNLTGNLFYPEDVKEKTPAILFIHGWKSSERSSLPPAEALSKKGFICLTFDMRGHGQSEGTIETATKQDFLRDALAAFDFLLQQKGVDKENISVVGSSLGGYLAALVTRERAIRNLVLRVPANYPDDTIDQPQIKYSWDNPEILAWRSQVVSDNATVSLQALAQFTGNVLIIESELDTVVPHQTIENYKNAVADKNHLKYIVMKGAEHSLQTDSLRIEFSTLLLDWFADKV